MPSCSQCSVSFTISEYDKKFYTQFISCPQKTIIPQPEACPDCRRQRRLAFRNESNLYQRKCDLCKKEIISIYSAKKEFPVYCSSCFWSDQWTPFTYGKEFDFFRPFFEQFKELFDAVPKLSLILADNENSEYNNSCANLKNCYLCFDGGFAQDCYYGETFDYVRNCVNFLCLQHCELCFACINCSNCYHLFYSHFCQNCSDSYFLLDCIGCKNCFGCANLKQKEYCWFNEQLTKEEFEMRSAKLEMGSFKAVEEMHQKVLEFWRSQPKRAYRGNMSENVTGDNINNCTNSFANFDCNNLQDCNYCNQVVLPAKDCQDIDKWGDNIELCYNSSGVGNGGQNVIASYYSAFNASNIFHSAYCWFSCSNLFGCVGLNRQKQYCILNKQYSQEAYEKLIKQIIEHMQISKEWTEFFPPQLSAFGYNESVAQEYYPLNKDQALAQGFKWSDEEQNLALPHNSQSAANLADNIKDVTDDILNTAVICKETQKLFRITKAELQFYRAHNIPLPRTHPKIRNAFLKAQKNPRKLWQRRCDKCGQEISSSYSPNRKELVYCEKCYTAEF
ncbi:MAG: hypothetical protein HY817_04145 [Candidatus Abawacabacteria bacterium]|nr:hypothetical protein [Candidatus Abawacabacteria bacterium]